MEILDFGSLTNLDIFQYGETEDGIFRDVNVDLLGNVIEPEPNPIGLYRIDLLVTQSSGPLTIELFNIVMSDSLGQEPAIGQESYSLTICP